MFDPCLAHTQTHQCMLAIVYLLTYLLTSYLLFLRVDFVDGSRPVWELGCRGNQSRLSRGLGHAFPTSHQSLAAPGSRERWEAVTMTTRLHASLSCMWYYSVELLNRLPAWGYLCVAVFPFGLFCTCMLISAGSCSSFLHGTALKLCKCFLTSISWWLYYCKLQRHFFTSHKSEAVKR